jgi:hypothetical protein
MKNVYKICLNNTNISLRTRYSGGCRGNFLNNSFIHSDWLDRSTLSTYIASILPRCGDSGGGGGWCACAVEETSGVENGGDLESFSDILTQCLIWLIEYSYHQSIPSFLEAHLQKTPGLSMLGPEQFQDEWPTRKFSRVCTSEDKRVQKRLGLVCGASLWYYGAARSNDHQTLVQSGWGVTNGIRADPHDFTGAYRSVEKDMVVYGSGTWVRTHDAWILWEGHGMVRILLTGHTIHVCLYSTNERDQEGTFLAWGWPTRTSVF